MDRQEMLALLNTVLRSREVPGRRLVPEDWSRVAQVFGRRPPDSFVIFIDLLSDYSCPGVSLLGAAAGQTEEGSFELAVALEKKMPTGWPHGLVPFWVIGNGDLVALDLRRPDSAPVVLRDHADGSIHEEFADFESFLRALPGELSDG